MRLLPSPLFGLVMTIARTARPFSARLMRVRSDRYCSAASDCGASAATSRGSRVPQAIVRAAGSTAGAGGAPCHAGAVRGS